MVWGQFFESVIRKHCESIHNNIIYETGSYEKYKGHAVSPDGIGIINNEIVLYEYKTIFARKLIHGEIPNYYLTQVWAGLETFIYCKYAVYIEAVIKLAPLFSKGQNAIQYKYNFPPTYKKKQDGDTIKTDVICWGAIAIYKSSTYDDKFRPGSIAMDKLKTLEWPVDFGDMFTTRDIFEALLEVYAEGNFVELDYLYQMENDPTDDFDYTKDDILKMANLDTRQLIGAFKWKMLDKNEVIIEKRPGFIDEVMPQIQLVNETTRQCANLDFKEKERLIKNASLRINDINIKSEIYKLLSSM